MCRTMSDVPVDAKALTTARSAVRFGRHVIGLRHEDTAAWDHALAAIGDALRSAREKEHGPTTHN